MKRIRYAVALILLLASYYVQAQDEKPVGPTSATDSDVRVHYHRKGIRMPHIRRGKKMQGENKVFGRQNHFANGSILMRTRTPANEARVFKRQNHFARKESNHTRHKSSGKRTASKRN